MRGLRWLVGAWAVALGCVEPVALDPPAAARVGARSVMWVWADPTPTYWLEDLDGAPRLPVQRPQNAMGVRAMFYRCPAAQLNLKLGLEPWSVGCVPPTERRYREEGGRLIPDTTHEVPACSPCLLWPLQVTTTLTLPEGYSGDVGLFLDDDTAMISAFSDGLGRSDLFRVEFDPPSVTKLLARSSTATGPLGPMTMDGERVIGVRDEGLEALTLGRDDFVTEPLGPTRTQTTAEHAPAGTLLPQADRLLWSTGYGALWSFTRSSSTPWRRLEVDWKFSHSREHSIRTSMEDLGRSTVIGVGVSSNSNHYETQTIEEEIVPYARRYFLLHGDRLEFRALPDVEEPVSVARTSQGPYLIDRRGAAYPIEDDGKLGQRREVANGSDLLFAVGGQDRLFYAGRDGTFWPIFPESKAVCPAVSVAYGSILITRGRYLLHNSGVRLTFAEMLPVPDCNLEPISEEEP